MLKRVVFDIETSGRDFDSLDEQQQDYLTRFAKTPEELEAEKLKVNLYPYTAEVVCIGLLNVDSQNGEVLVQAPTGTQPWKSPDGNIAFIPGSERELIERFWDRIKNFDQMVTFNGRTFDGPFLHIRSAMLGVKASRNLLPYRYDANQHCDLLDQLTFYGAFRKFSLDFICMAFGIDSPKRHGVTGLDVNALFREGRFREIAEYNALDIIATRNLFLAWDESMGHLNKRS